MKLTTDTDADVIALAFSPDTGNLRFRKLDRDVVAGYDASGALVLLMVLHAAAKLPEGESLVTGSFEFKPASGITSFDLPTATLDLLKQRWVRAASTASGEPS